MAYSDPASQRELTADKAFDRDKRRRDKEAETRRKAEAFREYIKARKLLNSWSGRAKGKFFVDQYRKKMDRLESEHPDFPAAYIEYEAWRKNG